MKSSKSWVLGTVSIVAFTIFFLVPFAFIFLIAVKDQQQAAELSFSWPTHFQLWQNLKDTISSRDYILVIAFINSTILTVASVTIMVILGAMVAYILQRRRSGSVMCRKVLHALAPSTFDASKYSCGMATMPAM